MLVLRLRGEIPVVDFEAVRGQLAASLLSQLEDALRLHLGL